MGKYSFVLSDALYKQYYLFKTHQNYDKEIISHLLKFYTGEFLTNVRQLVNIGVDKEVSPSLHISLYKAGFRQQSLEELAEKTDYKLILSLDDNVDFPYVSIMSDPISSYIAGCYYRDTPRDKACMHIKSLCKGAKKVCLYDKYLNQSTDILKLFLPRKELEVIYHPDQLAMSDIIALGTYCPQWSFRGNNSLLTHHDRYIIIDDKMEIILSSGFMYLGRTMKELTYIVRPVLGNRLVKC